MVKGTKKHSLVNPPCFLVVEGAGQKRELSTECRRAFTKILCAYGISNKPRIVWGGGRTQAYDKFKTHVENGDKAFLLIDSEEPVAFGSPTWGFFKKNGGELEWLPSHLENDKDLHFMVQCMENWFLAADPPLCVGAKNTPLKTSRAERECPESVSKQHVMGLLNQAFKEAGQRKYEKGQHSFELLAKIDPRRLCDVAPWAQRFFKTLDERCK